MLLQGYKPLPKMACRLLDKSVMPLCWLLEQNDMQRAGIRNTMKMARFYSRFKFRGLLRYRKDQLRNHLDELLAENGTPAEPIHPMKDGWLLDTSHKLPHLERVLADGAQIIKERGGISRDHFGKPFIQDMWTHDLTTRFPSFIDFATSSEVVATVARYFGFIPALSGHMPPGIRLVESNAKLDPGAGGPYRASQLFHLDYHCTPMVYVIVLLKDVTPNSGPWCFLSASTSKRAAEGLNYRARGSAYRVTDERIYSVIDKRELQQLIYPAGTVLFIDSSKCFHYGSRDPWDPRYQLMYAYVSPCRSDFSDVLRQGRIFPVNPNDSRLRQMILNREYGGERRE